MFVNRSDSDKGISFSVSGRVDTTNYEEFHKQIHTTALSGNNVSFDFEDLEYISSSGLRVLLTVLKEVGQGYLEIINVSESVYTILETVGYTQLINVKKKCELYSSFTDLSFKKLLSNKAKANSSDVFLREKSQVYTWEEIDKCSQIVASDLSDLGVTSGSHVGIVSGNSANWIITFFAIQKLGAISCLLNPKLRVSEVINTARLGDISIMCCGDIADDTPELFHSLIDSEGNPILHCYDIRQEICFKNRLDEFRAISGLFDFPVESDDACVMIFTSGSSGTPKGVLLSAYNIINSATYVAQHLLLTKADSICLILPLFHIFGLVAGLFCAVISSATLVIPENMRVETLLNVISDNKCTIFHSVPTMLIALMNSPVFTSDKVSSIRATIISGASASESQMSEFLEQFPNDHFLSSYGLSEMAPVSITELDDTIPHIIETVGKPLESIEIRIFDSNSGGDCATGQIGEILLRGFNTMLCYYKYAPEDQAIDAQGWIHTGDLGFLDSEGYLHLSGRIKELIIKGGENIMPVEVVNVIALHPDVNDVKVVGIPDDFYGENVCACIQMKKGCSFDRDKMDEFLSDKLAKFKIPHIYITYDTFPLLANGKVDMITLKNNAVSQQGDKTLDYNRL